MNSRHISASPFLGPGAFIKQRQHRLDAATKPFLARGAAIARCASCLLAQSHCLCPWRKAFAKPIAVDFILLMHRDEFLKPTNTGRLITDAFPASCYVFEWSRLTPDPALLKLIQDPGRVLSLLYAPTEFSRDAPLAENLLALGHPSTETSVSSLPHPKTTVVILDGTWRQAARMYNHSQWLWGLPCISLSTNPQQPLKFQLRKASAEHRFSTAQAAQALLDTTQEVDAATHLGHLFRVFQAHYQASRACQPYPLTASHDYLGSGPQGAPSHFEHKTP
jgi:DTW domain-containing protein